MRHRKPPLLLRKGEPTMALNMLRCCEQAKGYAPAYYKRVYRPGWEGSTCLKLSRFGWVEERRSGPRGGKRYHITELGQVVLSITRQHGKTATPILRLLPGYTT